MEEEGIIEIRYKYNEVTESYDYYCSVRVKNLNQEFILEED